MGIVLDTELNRGVLTELQKCNLYPHDTAKIKKMFVEYRQRRIHSTDNQSFGYRINAQQLALWTSCDPTNAVRVIQRWFPIIGIHKNDTKAILEQIPSLSSTTKRALSKRRGNLIVSSNAEILNVNVLDDKDDRSQINMLTLFCAMALLSAGSVSDKLRLVLYLFDTNRHSSIRRKELDTIIHHIIMAVSVLLDLTRHIPKLQRSAKRHIYQKHCNKKNTFNKISRGTLAIWLATSPYVLRVFSLENTTDSKKMDRFLYRFYGDDKAPRRRKHRAAVTSVILPKKRFSRKLLKNVSVPNLDAINKSLKGTHLDFSSEQSVHRVIQKHLTKAYSAKDLRRNVLGPQHSRHPLHAMTRAHSRDRKFQRVDSFASTFSERRHSLGNHDDGAKQYYGGSVPFDLPAVSIEKICSNFDKQMKIAMKVQSKYRAPALVNESNVKAVVEGFQAISGGKDFIQWSDLRMDRSNGGVVKRTLERIFQKCDVRRSKRITIREFLYSQYGNANQEELDRAVSFMSKPPKVYGWTIRFFKRLFDELTDWSGLGLTDEPKVKLSDYYALCIHCSEIRDYVIRSTRLQRARMSELASFKEAITAILEDCGFDPKSEKAQIIWIWIQSTNPMEHKQKVQLQLLYDSMEHKSDGTISRYQLENVTDWIFPNIFRENLLEYLFYKFHHVTCERLDHSDFVYFMEYIWSVFQREFTKRKINIMLRKSRFGNVHKFRSLHNLTPSAQHVLIRTFAEPTKEAKKSNAQKVKFKKVEITNDDLLQFSEMIKQKIESYGDDKMGMDERESKADYRFWSSILRKESAVKAWMRLVFLAIRLEDVQKRESGAESVFGYMNAAENVDVKTDFKYTKYYSID